jgi:hypothetical protein
MNSKLHSRYFHPVFSLLMSLTMAFRMSGIITYITTGDGRSFWSRWSHAFPIVWILAFPPILVLVLAPGVRKLIAKFVALP